MITPEELLIRGKGSFINCTDYDDTIEAMKLYAIEYHKARVNEPEARDKICSGCKKLVDAYKMLAIKQLKLEGRQ